MDYTQFMTHTLTALGFRLHAVWNAFDPPLDLEQGWPIKLPDVEFGSDTLLLLHFQDIVTPTDRGIEELLRVEQHYGDRANRVLITHYNHRLDRYYQGPLHLIEFNNHDYQIVLNLKQRQQEWMPWMAQADRGWQCLNGRQCDHRRRAVDMLRNTSGGILSWGNDIPLPQWAYATYRGTENEDNFIRLRDVYGRSAINIVTETQYDRAPGVVCEKTYLALLAQQVPIVIGYPGIVADCESMGLDMFRDLVDTSYDTLPNDQRVEQAILRNWDLITGHRDLGPYQARLQSQQQWLLDQWPQKLRDDFAAAARQLAQTI
jgi:hypothetical protein